MARKWTDEERKAFGEKMRALKAAKQLSDEGILKEEPKEELKTAPEHKGEVDLETMQRQIDEVMETNALLKAALLGKQQLPNQQFGVKGGQLIGEVEKYLVDPSNYPNPCARLAAEPRLKPLAFDYNYELEYGFSVRPYTTQTGLHMKEPEFTITLNRIVLDDQGNQTGKRYRAKRLMFHEDPEAALAIARDNNILIEDSDEKTFLNEMRYLRARDWLFGIFWPAPTQQADKIREEVIGGTIVQVFTKSSEESAGVDFGKITNKI